MHDLCGIALQYFTFAYTFSIYGSYTTAITDIYRGLWSDSNINYDYIKPLIFGSTVQLRYMQDTIYVVRSTV